MGTSDPNPDLRLGQKQRRPARLLLEARLAAQETASYAAKSNIT